MWEVCIEANSSNGHLIDYIVERMEPVLSEVGGIKSTIQLGSTKSVALGCAMSQSSRVAGVLRQVLCDVVCEKMKFDFLHKRINLVPAKVSFLKRSSKYAPILTANWNAKL